MGDAVWVAVTVGVEERVDCAVRLAVTELDCVRLGVPVWVWVPDSVTVLEGVQELVSERLFVEDPVLVPVPEFVDCPVPDRLVVCVKLLVMEGVDCALRLLLGVTVGLALKVVVEVLDQGLGV